MEHNKTYQFQDAGLGRFLQTHYALLFIPACIMDKEGSIVWWNLHAERTSGRIAADMLHSKKCAALFATEDPAAQLFPLFRDNDRLAIEALFPSATYMWNSEGDLSIIVEGDPACTDVVHRVLLCGGQEHEGFLYVAWANLADYDFARSPAVDLFQLLGCLDRNGDVWFGVNQSEQILYLSRGLIDALYGPDILHEELMDTSMFMNMTQTVAQDHERTINSLDEHNSRHAILHYPLKNRQGKSIWTQSWPNIVRVNGQKANFSLLHDITAEKERDVLLQGVLASLHKGHQHFAEELLTMFSGRSTAIARTIEILLRAALSLVTVAIYGETGTGKSLAARLVHQLSSRAEGPFVYVNCGAIPDELFESHFFGHVKGAFTGAIRNAEGLLTRADQGTLFLDEIAELSPRAQAKLLQALSEKSYTPVGSTEEMRSKFRLIVATNRNLEELVRLGAFREDLYYRVNVLDVHLPPLRDRKDDIPLLLNTILQRNSITVNLPADVIKILCTHSWPGNIRELENVTLRYAAEHNLDFFQPLKQKNARQNSALGESMGQDMPLREQVAHFEKGAIESALLRHRWNRASTAQALGMTRMTLFRKMREHGLLEKE